MSENGGQPHHVVIVGGGFGGLYAAMHLGGTAFKVTLVDRRNFHLFQPLLYQVATGGLSPGEIASPLRAVLNRHRNLWALQAEVVDLDVQGRKVLLAQGELAFDSLIVATGAHHDYFGHDDWSQPAPGLKTVEDALEIRSRIFRAFESAEWERDPRLREQWLTFLVVGGGPTGVEMAGAIGELAHGTLKNDFRNINSRDARIFLLEGSDRILPGFSPRLSVKATRSLARLGVTVQTGALLTDIQGEGVTIRRGDEEQRLACKTIIWAAGVRFSPLGEILARQTSVPLDKLGRVMVEPELSLPGFPNLYVIGDLAHFSHQDGGPLPGLAPVAMQQGKFAAQAIKRRLRGRPPGAFRYRDKGKLAVIGRNAAVAEIGALRISGFLAWLIWLLVHIRYLIEFDNQFLVLFQWAWNYFTRNRGARLITGGEWGSPG